MMEAVGKERGPFVVPAAILSEVFYFLEQRLNQSEIDIFLEDLSNHVYMVDCGEQDYQRIRTLVGQVFRIFRSDSRMQRSIAMCRTTRQARSLR